jgi:hypothetical protein
MYVSDVRNYHTAIISKLENGPRAVLSDMITKVPGTKSLRLDANIGTTTNIRILKCLDRWTVHAVMQLKNKRHTKKNQIFNQ